MKLRRLDLASELIGTIGFSWTLAAFGPFRTLLGFVTVACIALPFQLMTIRQVIVGPSIRSISFFPNCRLSCEEHGSDLMRFSVVCYRAHEKPGWQPCWPKSSSVRTFLRGDDYSLVNSSSCDEHRWGSGWSCPIRSCWSSLWLEGKPLTSLLSGWMLLLDSKQCTTSTMSA